jgi:hypothetical protein
MPRVGFLARANQRPVLVAARRGCKWIRAKALRVSARFGRAVYEWFFATLQLDSVLRVYFVSARLLGIR